MALTTHPHLASSLKEQTRYMRVIQNDCGGRGGITHQIRETSTILQFHSKMIRTVSRDRVPVYPGTEGTNQNRH